MAQAIGIDLGTSELRAAIFDRSVGERATILRQGKREVRMPAAVAVDAGGHLVAGDRARRLLITRPRATIAAPLGLVGRRFDELDADAWAPLTLVRDARGDARVRLGERVFAPAQLIAAQLLTLRAEIEAILGERLPPVTLTIHAGLRDATRRAIRDAAAIAGIEVLRLLPATTAAALTIHAEGNLVDEPTLALCDLGGGAFTAAIVELREGSVEALASVSVDIGGRDVDRALADHLTVEAARACDNEAIGDDPVARVRIRDAAEKAKIALSSERERPVHLPFLSADEAGPKHLAARLTQGKLEALAGNLVERCADALGRALAASGRPADAIADLVLLGRGAELPLLQDRLEAALRRPPTLRWIGADPAARGAARMAAILAGDLDGPSVHEIVGRPITIEREEATGAASEGEEAAPVGPELLFPATAALPASRTELFEAVGDGPTAHFHLSEGERARSPLGEHILRGRPAIDLTFNLDADGVLELSFRETFRGQEATLEVIGRGGMPAEELAALVEHQRAVEEALARQLRTQELTLRLQGRGERGQRVLVELAEGIPEGTRERLAALLQAAQDAVVAGSLEALESADAELEALLGEALPPAIQQAIRGVSEASPPPPGPTRPRERPARIAAPIVVDEGADTDADAEASDDAG